jgi:hypothetical protein
MPGQRAVVASACLTALLALPLGAQRRVDGPRLISDSLPAAVFTLDSTLTYLGTQSFILYGVAHAEQHFFADLDRRRVKRLVWMQFEGYLADNDQTYNYSAYPTVEVSGRPFHHNGGIRRAEAVRPRAGSDGDRMLQFLRDKGYTLPNVTLYQRLVWLLDSPARNEVMVIYMEDLEGVSDERARMLRGVLLQRATSVLQINDR